MGTGTCSGKCILITTPIKLSVKKYCASNIYQIYFKVCQKKKVLYYFLLSVYITQIYRNILWVLKIYNSSCNEPSIQTFGRLWNGLLTRQSGFHFQLRTYFPIVYNSGANKGSRDCTGKEAIDKKATDHYKSYWSAQAYI